jgi:hypothetical protein
LKQAILDLTPKKALSMRADCEARSQDFSLDSFAEQLKNHVK